MSVITRLFLSNRTQAVRLPKAVAFDESVSEVEIDVVGDTRVIRPAGSRVDAFWDSELRISDDFGREQPAVPQERVWA
ncbi:MULTISPECIES: type II toxin-antitoxin system VapB family antitoxin [unclassified Nocardioides]|uniref:type II toxin-antitoxin system VapB family antitoxin n=1 Tax=unclassified Nocardioides TaxID=2615069 RepID=UPI00114DF1ED|nr:MULTISPECIES: type II toxin-antitoxin system VapB family antitoxin [unclassified Nocardioides]TQK72518.1 antitoxin VapB [Nocardioides sp. SLBN-35]WGY03276.1 type II toxin-antitoxin system VapB family antitoxin [Nocardioides sp. QY071]